MTGPIEDVFARFAALNAAPMTPAPLRSLNPPPPANPSSSSTATRAHATSRADLLALATVLKERGALGAGISEQDAAD